MPDQSLILEILSQIEIAANRITRRFTAIEKPDDFLSNDESQDKLDGICMMLIAIGESLKHLDVITGNTLLPRYPAVDWKGAKGVRDVISHQYFDLDAEAVFTICKEHIPFLITTVGTIKTDLLKKET
jgi:uncharacterized protein with HEPN domain